MQIHLKTLGCRLKVQGHAITRDISAAQLVVINSCAITQDAARKSRQLIRRIHWKLNHELKINV